MKKYNYFLFFIGFLFLQISSLCVNVSFLSNYLMFFKITGVLILTLSAFITSYSLKFSIKSFLIVVLIILFGFTSYYYSGNFMILSLVLLIVCCINSNFKTLIKIDFSIKLLILFFIITCYFLGLTTQIMVTRDAFVRNSFGFYHPNVLSLFLTIILMEYVYIRDKKSIIFIYVLALLLSLFIFYVVDSRTSIICIGLFCLLLPFQKKLLISNKKHSFILFFEKYLYEFLFFLSLISTILFINGTTFIYRIDSVLSGRIWLQNLFMKKYRVTLLGTAVDFFATLDNFYIRVLLCFGILGLLLLLVVYKKNIVLALKNKDYIYSAIIITLLFYGLMEHSTQDICFNPFLLLFATQLTNKGEKYE